MAKLRYTLIADGSSDKTFLRIIKWTLDHHFPQLPADGLFADYRQLPKPPKTLAEKYRLAQELYPADIYIIHRDAETTDVASIEMRKSQVRKEIGDEAFGQCICIVPIKMMETWLLIETDAIKKASGNRNNKQDLGLPSLSKLEKIPQPKDLLNEILKSASGLKGRNLDKFNPHKAIHLVAEYILDFSLLRELVAFQVFEADLISTVNFWLAQTDNT